MKLTPNQIEHHKRGKDRICQAAKWALKVWRREPMDMLRFRGWFSDYAS